MLKDQDDIFTIVQRAVEDLHRTHVSVHMIQRKIVIWSLSILKLAIQEYDTPNEDMENAVSAIEEALKHRSSHLLCTHLIGRIPEDAGITDTFAMRAVNIKNAQMDGYNNTQLHIMQQIHYWSLSMTARWVDGNYDTFVCRCILKNSLNYLSSLYSAKNGDPMDACYYRVGRLFQEIVKHDRS